MVKNCAGVISIYHKYISKKGKGTFIEKQCFINILFRIRVYISLQNL